MSISNSDKKESFSKKISRRFFFQYEDREIREHAISKHANIQHPRHLNRKEPQSYRDTLFHTFSIDKQICSPQNDHHRRVSFVLPTDARSDSPQYFEDPAHKSAEKARRQTDEHLLSYRERPRQHECAGPDDERLSRKFDRSDYVNDEDDYRISSSTHSWLLSSLRASYF